MITNPSGIKDVKYTTDKEKVEELYPNKKIKASTIMLYQGDKGTFIIPYGKELMIDDKAYQVVDGEIDLDFIEGFYRSIED